MSWFTSELKRYIPELEGQDITPTSIIEGTISGGADAFGYIFDPNRNPLMQYPYELFQRGMTESQNLFSSSHETLDKFQTGFSDELSKAWGSTNISWNPQEGILGSGTPNAFMPSVGGSTSPNLEQFSIGDKNFQKIMGKLQGRGYLHELIPAIANPEHAIGLHDPRNWKDHVDTILGGAISGKEQELLQSLTDSASSALTPSEEEEEVKVKGPGTLRGREATLKLNLGAKGLGRKSLRIGTKGMGKPKTGKYRENRSGRTSRGYG